MEEGVCVLCAATALTCGLLLLGGCRRRRGPLLLWCGLFFLALFLENAILFVDVVLVPRTDLSLMGNSIALAGTIFLLYGMIWEVK